MPVEKEVLIDTLSEELIVDLTAQLVAIPTPNPPGGEKPCAEFILKTLQGWGLEAELVLEPDAERPQVVAWHRGTGAGPTLILNAHMDTVGVGDREAWHTPPYEATRRGKRLYGRGTCDMKGSLAIGMAVLKTLHDADVRFAGTLMLQAPMGEEMDEPGTKTLLQLGYSGDYAIVLEPTALRIGPASRGVSWHKVTLRGPSVHCGLAEGDAPDVMACFGRIAVALNEYHQQLSQRTHPMSPSPSCRITLAEAGQAHNSLAGRCEFTVDRRMLPGERHEDVRTELEQIMAGVMDGVQEVSFDIAFLEWNEPVQAPLDSALVEALRENVAQVGGRTAEIWAVPYGCDVRNFIYDLGIPAVNFGAGDYRVCHQPNEFVEVDELMSCARVVMGTVVDLLQ